MKKLAAGFFVLMIIACFQLKAEGIVGLWKTVDEKTGKPQSIVAVYEYGEKYYGRIIGSFGDDGTLEDSIYNPSSKAKRLVGEPFYSGLDFIWGLQKRGNKYVGGEILDPRRGKTYDVEMWTRDANLIVRGKLLFFGKNITWYPAEESDFPEGFERPDLTKLEPSIPRVK